MSWIYILLEQYFLFVLFYYWAHHLICLLLQHYILFRSSSICFSWVWYWFKSTSTLINISSLWRLASLPTANPEWSGISFSPILVSISGHRTFPSTNLGAFHLNSSGGGRNVVFSHKFPVCKMASPNILYVCRYIVGLTLTPTSNYRWTESPWSTKGRESRSSFYIPRF